jgi:hypothetical protein
LQRPIATSALGYDRYDLADLLGPVVFVFAIGSFIGSQVLRLRILRADFSFGSDIDRRDADGPAVPPAGRQCTRDRENCDHREGAATQIGRRTARRTSHYARRYAW